LNRILRKEMLAKDIFLLEVKNSYIARNFKAGQFVILRVDKRGERIPLTVVEHTMDTITLVFLKVGKTTNKLASLSVGDKIENLLGPLGNPIDVPYEKNTVFVGGGVGTAAMIEKIRAFREKNNRITSIIGAKSKEYIIFEKEIKEISDETYVTTDDGTYGRKGFVTEVLEEILKRGGIDEVVAVGPTIMMKVVSEVTKKYGIKTIVSLNPIMVDGTGMCGSCRVIVGGKQRFACVDGPCFDGHMVDWESLLRRISSYRELESVAVEKGGDEGKEG